MTPESVAKNTLYLSLATVFQKILSTLYFFVIARAFDNESVGKYTFVLSLTTIFGVFVELGLAAVLTREVARDASKAQDSLRNITGAKIVTAVITYAVLFLFVFLMGYSPEIRNLALLSGLIMVVDSFNVSFYAVFRGIQRLRYEALGMVIGQGILIALGITFMALHFPLYTLILAILCASLFNAVYSITLLSKKTGISISPLWNYHALKTLVVVAFPFMMLGILMRIYGYIDIVMLYHFLGAREVSFYTAAYKITFALSFLPAAFGSALYPAFASYFHQGSREALSATFTKANVYLLILAFPITFGGITLADKIIPFVYTDRYNPATASLQILLIALVFIFLSYPIGAILNACNLQKQNMYIMACTLVANIIALLLFIPVWGYNGASIATVLSSFTLLLLSLFLARKLIVLRMKSMALRVSKMFLSALAMTLALLLLKDRLPLLLLIPLGACVYASCLWIFRGFDQEDIDFLKGSFLKMRL